jgi:very-short-patch-repair endonuclease
MLRMRGGRLITSRRMTKKAEQEQFEDLFDFHLRAERAPVFLRQHQFALHLGREWRIDFAWPEIDLKVAVEIQGGIWQRDGGAHSHPINIMRNMEKYNALAALGWRLLQFSTDQVKSGSALQYTMTVLRGEVPDPL